MDDKITELKYLYDDLLFDVAKAKSKIETTEDPQERDLWADEYEHLKGKIEGWEECLEFLGVEL